MSCPYCGSTDIADSTDDKRACLDCDRTWTARRSVAEEVLAEFDAATAAPPLIDSREQP